MRKREYEMGAFLVISQRTVILCFITGDDTITTDTPGEHKLKEV